MAGTLTPTPYQTVLDGDGVAVSGAKIYTYEAGTTTNATTYTTSALSEANANPIVADSAGRYVAYLSAGANLRFIIKTSADVTIDDQDNVQAVPGTSVNLDIEGTVGEAVTAGQVLYLSSAAESSPLTAGKWYLTDSDAAATSTTPQSIGVAVSAIAINTAGTIRLAGEVDSASSVVVGTTYYVGATPGAIVSSAPSLSRQVGVAITTSSLLLAATTAVVTALPNPITQDLLFTDNTYDIGKSGASRPRDLFASRNAVVGGTLGVTGAVTLSGGLNTPLVVAQGGTGVAALTANSLLLGAGTGNVTFAAPGTSGNVLTSNGTVWASATPTTAKTPHVNEGRLTLTSGTAVTTADVTGAGTVYFALDKGDQIALYDGSSAWETVVFAEMSIALSGGTASKPNDIFLDYNGGSPALAILAWTNDTTRATALVKQNGVWVKTGDTQQRYLGTLWLDGSKQCADSNAKRHCWNLENQRIRPLKRIDYTDSWTYTSASYQQANGSSANQVEVVLGVAQSVLVILGAISGNSGNGRWRSNAIGKDGTSANGITGRCTGTGGEVEMTTSVYDEITAVGRHYFVWLEMSSAGDTTTWYGDNGGTTQFSGLAGSVMG
jgi:hypothetical protein